MKVDNSKIYEVKVIDINELFDASDSDMLDTFCESAPFSFGDTNYTLISIQRFINHFEEIFESTDNTKKFLDEIKKLDSNVYINLE